MKTLSMFLGAVVFVALSAFGQDRGQAGQGAPPTEPGQSPPYQAQPPSPTLPTAAPEASISKTVSGTVESLTEGKSMKIKTAAGKTKTFNLREAFLDPSIKVGSAVRVTQTRDVNGKGSLTVEPDQGEKK